ncbi:MAG: tRNA 2-thiouridine(34) synthase MnmA [Thermotogota bacterium]|nr:tRNA 2-thiouridine(34) synthase MnmA [Thermotogota bacterium]
MKVGIALSGGVDSASAAIDLMNEGYEVTAYHMKTIPDETFKIFPEKTKVCCSPSDTLDAMKIADILGIELKIIDIKNFFEKNIINYFVEEYLVGRTPNPCVVCNDVVKFGKLMNTALEDGMDMFSSGHYAKIINSDAFGYVILRGKSKQKDQSYFLSRIKKHKLERIMFPNGAKTKQEIRKLAEQSNLPIHRKEESQEICFIPDNDYRRFLNDRNIKPKAGNIVDENGKILGKHKGLPFYTIGQRKGLGITSVEKLYVIEFDYENNLIIVGPREKTMNKHFTINHLNWFVDEPQKLELKCMIRSSMSAVPCEIKVLTEKTEIIFEEPASAITPGQLAVLYHKEYVIGSGFISEIIE